MSLVHSPTPPPPPTQPSQRLVEPVAAEHDLDNLRLDQMPPGERTMRATFELEALLLTGMCVDLAALAARVQSGVRQAGRQEACVRTSVQPSSPSLQWTPSPLPSLPGRSLRQSAHLH